MENPMAPVRDRLQDDSRVEREADGRRVPAPEVVGDESVSAAMRLRTG